MPRFLCAVCCAVPLEGIPLKKVLARKAERAALLYTKAERKANKYPAPHGYGDGWSECTCSRCDRALKFEVAAEDAFAAWKSAAARYSACV